jgi:peptidoglycan/xylan/chitin deacetylase (PgdA/CDA1 family)
MSAAGTFKAGIAGIIAPVARTLTASRPRILMYHRFGADGEHRRLGPTEFERQLRYLKSHFNVARLDDVVRRLRGGQALQPRTVVLTVDDGYRDFATHAYPMLKKHGVPATVYVVSRFVSQECWLWFDALQWITGTARPGRYSLDLAGVQFDAELTADADRHRLWTRVADLCVTQAPAQQWAIVEQFGRQLNVNRPELPPAEYRAMRWDELNALDPDIVEVGGHTASHPILSRCSVDVQKSEIRECKTDIERLLGREISAFCYPNGMPGDFTPDTQAIVEACGFSSAVMACGGFASLGSGLFRLERLGAPEDSAMFRNALNGIWHLRGTG